MIALWQDEEEGEYVFEKKLPSVKRFIRTVNCALKNNEEFANLCFGTNKYTVKTNDLIEFGVLNTDCADEKINIEAFTLQGMLSNEYVEDIFNVNNIEFKEGKQMVKIPGNAFNIYVMPDANSGKKQEVYSFIKNLFDGQRYYPPNDPNSLAFEDLEYEPYCAFKNISYKKRKELLEEAIKNHRYKVSEQKTIINLIKTVKETNTAKLLQFLNGNNINQLYDGVNDYRGEFISEVFKLWIEEPTACGNFKGALKIDDQHDRNYEITIRDDKIDIELIYKSTQVTSGFGATMGNTPEDLGSYAPFDVIAVNFKGSYAIDLHGKQIKAPVIWIKHLLEKNNAQAIENIVSRSLDVGLLFTGVSQISLGLKALTKARTAKNLIRLSLGITDLATLSLNNLCQNNNSDFCKAWNQYQFYISLGLITANILNELKPLASKLANNYDDVKNNFSEIQRTNMESFFPRTAVKLKDAVYSEVDILFDFMKKSYKPFLTGYGISAGTQMVANYAKHGDWVRAANEFDQIDALADGALWTVTMNSTNVINLFRNGGKTILYKPINNNLAKVFTLEFVKVTFNYNLLNNDIQSLFDGDIDAYMALSNFIFSMLAEYTANKTIQQAKEEVGNLLIKWSNKNIKNLNAYKSLNEANKTIVYEMDAIVKTKAFSDGVNASSSIAYKLVENVIDSNPTVESKKTHTEETHLSYEDFFEQRFTKQDNTSINDYNVIP
jgi:hypothetical protein